MYELYLKESSAIFTNCTLFIYESTQDSINVEN